MTVYDLTHKLDSSTPPYPGDEPFVLEKYRFMDEHRYNAYRISGSFHTGTHIDMPYHLSDDKKLVSDFPPEIFCGRCACMDFSGEMLLDAESLPDEKILLLYTGHDKKYGMSEYFTHHPVISERLCRLIIEHGVTLLGIDFPSPDVLPFPLHRALSAAGIMIIENMAKLHQIITKKDLFLCCFPLNIAAEASQVRAVAIEGYPR